ncbi:hypothetical protein HAX54_021950 [Datura stramonium]|uniref:Putative plant transposon protein domain-containing protein n=1 Tax=Datura stramonium TaxID=4076 RepID=A0ABS8Y7U6_DATST|nr:hypothetical protein [Datura stramonium]
MGGSQRRNARVGNPYHLYDETTDSKNEIRRVEIKHLDLGRVCGGTSNSQTNTFRKAFPPRAKDTSREAFMRRYVESLLTSLKPPLHRLRNGIDFSMLVKIVEFNYRMREQHNQHPWLVWVLTDGQSPWLKNPREKIYISILTFTTMFWWAVVRHQLFPTGGDNILGEDRVVLVASLMLRFPLNIGNIILDEMRARATKFSTSLLFPCLLTRLCKEAHVPILDGIDVEMVQVNERLKDFTVSDLAKFAAKLAKAQFDTQSRGSGQWSRVESKSLITPPPAMEVSPDDTFSVTITTSTNVDVPGVTTSQPVLLESQV